jgi:hypothetical protein
MENGLEKPGKKVWRRLNKGRGDGAAREQADCCEIKEMKPMSMPY